jgi:hypothetical protein
MWLLSFFILVSTIGAFKIKTSDIGEDMPKKYGFYKDILFFFEIDSSGVIPLES